MSGLPPISMLDEADNLSRQVNSFYARYAQWMSPEERAVMAKAAATIAEVAGARIDSEYQRLARSYDDDELAMELSFAEGFGADADPNAPGWIAALQAERSRRQESRP